MPRKIAIVGTASTSNAAAPYDDPAYEIWGVSTRLPTMTRADRWYEIHRLAGEPQEWANAFRKVLREQCAHKTLPLPPAGTLLDPVPIYMIWPEPDLGDVREFRHEFLRWRFGGRFLSSTFSWQLADAIDELAPLVNGIPTIAPEGSEIFVCGVDMEHGTEYEEQRQGLFHFLGLAKALGINVIRLADSGISYEPIPYPFWQDDPLLNKLDRLLKVTRDRLASITATMLTTQDMIASARGALRELDLMEAGEIWPEGEDKPARKTYLPSERRKALEAQLEALAQTASQMARDKVGNEAAEEVYTNIRNYIKL